MKTRGAINKLRRIVLQRCEARGIDPAEVLLDMIEQETEFKFPAAKELMNYCYPKLLAQEFTLQDIPDDVFDQEVERRIHLKILKGEKVG